MKTDEIYESFTVFLDEYKEYFMSNIEVWYINMNKLKMYIDENGCRPNNHSINRNIKTSVRWLSSQLKNYKNKTRIMKTVEIYDRFTIFLNNYKQCF
jgi:hypothetical protein